VQATNGAATLAAAKPEAPKPDAPKPKPTTPQPAKLEAVNLESSTEPAKAELSKSAPAQRPPASIETGRKPAAAPLSSSGEQPPAAVSNGKPQSARWLRQQPGGHFTLQLFATTSREKRDAFVGQQEHPDRFATFEEKRNGGSWYAVTYGAYATQAEAKSAAAALPSTVGKVQPWIRTFASVQATLE